MSPNVPVVPSAEPANTKKSPNVTLASLVTDQVGNFNVFGVNFTPKPSVEFESLLVVEILSTRWLPSGKFP